MFSLIAAYAIIVYGLANVVFAFLPPPAWLRPRLGPDNRTRRYLAFLPGHSVEKVGRVVYGLASIAVAALMLVVRSM